MSTNITINQLPTANSIDSLNDILPIYTASSQATQGINRNTYLGLSSAPVGLTDTQTLTNKTLTAPTINGATLSGTLSGTYIIGGTPTFPASVATLTGAQTLTSKILTSPTINSPNITNATYTGDAIVGYTASTSGTIYGISIASGVITTTTALGPNTVTNSAIASGALYSSKVTLPYKFMAYRNATLSQNSNIIIIFDTKTGTGYDTGSNYSVTTGLFTVPLNGYYKFNGSVGFNSGGYSFSLGLQINGTGQLISGGEETSGSGGVTLVATFPPLYLTSGTTVGLYWGSSNSGGTTISVGVSPINTWFSGYLVGVV